jgi:transcriptional regulator with GAF, ATPase, and Fis domain
MSVNTLGPHLSDNIADGIQRMKHVAAGIDRQNRDTVISRESLNRYYEGSSTEAENYEDVQLNGNASHEFEKDRRQSFEGMIGCSGALKRTREQIMTVALTDSTVLIEGETGTGKELIAHAIHNLSPRRSRNFVRFNCAAIPLGLLESELFGHEKGAFTGAINRKIGRFELANNGTLFLDEIGDIPLELQAKLLRILQEQEFERLGSNQTQHVNVRLIAATHRDLKGMVNQKQFRSDLYFRLNIFPIAVPPLRQRKEDIPLLVTVFANDCIRRMNRKVTSIPAETMRALAEYEWPGNIRELQNFIERAVILSPDTVLCAPIESLNWAKQFNQTTPSTLVEAEYDHILKALKQTNWVVGGRQGAAMKLGLKRTTLIGKMRRLGLARSSEASAG